MPEIEEFTYVKLFHKMVLWEWYTDLVVTKAFIHCLISANRYPKRHKGTLIEAGSFVTSFKLFSVTSGLSIQQVRTAFDKLKLTHEITSVSTNQGTLIKVIKWADYQVVVGDGNTRNDKRDNKPITNQEQTDNKPVTTNKSNTVKQSNKVIEKNIRTPVKFGEYGHVLLTEEEYERLGMDRDKYVKFLDEYIEEKNYKSKNHNLAIRRWVMEAIEEKKSKNGYGKKRSDRAPTILEMIEEENQVFEMEDPKE